MLISYPPSVITSSLGPHVSLKSVSKTLTSPYTFFFKPS